MPTILPKALSFYCPLMFKAPDPGPWTLTWTDGFPLDLDTDRLLRISVWTTAVRCSLNQCTIHPSP